MGFFSSNKTRAHDACVSLFNCSSSVNSFNVGLHRRIDHIYDDANKAGIFATKETTYRKKRWRSDHPPLDRVIRTAILNACFSSISLSLSVSVSLAIASQIGGVISSSSRATSLRGEEFECRISSEVGHNLFVDGRNKDRQHKSQRELTFEFFQHLKLPQSVKNSTLEYLQRKVMEKVEQNISVPSSSDTNTPANRGVIDTAVPFESVKEVVTKIGGILDWKAHKADTLEKHNHVISELERIHVEISECKGQLETAREAKIQALRELEFTKSIIEELQLKLEKAQKEESQAKQHSEKGITSEASLTAKAQLEEPEALQGEKFLLNNERDAAMSKTQEVVSLANEIEEEYRIEDYLRWKKELKMTEEELHELDQQLALTKDLRLKLDTSTKLLQSLKHDLSKYISEKLKQDSENNDKEKLEEVGISMVKVKDKVDCLRVEVESLKSALNAEKAAITTLKQREGVALIVVSSLESDLDRTKQELEVMKIMEREAEDKMLALPMILHQKTEEVDQAKAAALMGRKQLRKAKEEAELAEASASTTRSKLLVALKEKEAAQESERVALAAAKVLQESEQAAQMGGKDSLPQVILPPDEYWTLSKRVHEAEKLAHNKLAAAVAQIDEAKISQNNSLERLKEAHRELEECKEAFKAASDKAKKGLEEKLVAEQELRKWRTELEQRRKANDAVKASVTPTGSPPTVPNDELKSMGMEEIDDVVHPGPGEIEPGVVVKKKKSFFPRLAHLLPKKKPQQMNSLGSFACLHAYYFEA